MALNKYFINNNSKYEQNLIEDLVVETIKIHGFEMYYIPRELNYQPDIFGDDPISSFRQHFIIEMFLDTVDGFEGDGDFIGKFGLEIRDSAKFVVSKKRFTNVTNKFRPMEGDLLYFPHTKKFFEIKFVEHENPFYQLGKNYVFSLTVELFQYSEESINTQIDEIDDAVEKQEFTKTLTIENKVGNGTYSVNSTVYSFENGATGGDTQEADSRGTVVAFSGTEIVMKDVVGEWKVSEIDTPRYIFNQNNTTYAQIVSTTTSTDDEESDNQIIDNLANEFLDFSETNPFGDMDF
jgi:hypothetical protein